MSRPGTTSLPGTAESSGMNSMTEAQILLPCKIGERLDLVIVHTANHDGVDLDRMERVPAPGRCWRDGALTVASGDL
jgi:hypothetical protein